MKKIFLSLWFILLVIGYFVAGEVLDTNIELIEQFVLTDNNGTMMETVQHITSDKAMNLKDAKAKVQKFFHLSYGALGVFSFIFAVLVARRMYVSSDHDLKDTHKRTNRHIAFLLLSMLVLVITGYCVQLGIQNPLQGSDRVYGQPSRFYFGTEANLLSFTNLRTNPFVWPSVVFAISSGALLFLSGSTLRYGRKKVQGFLDRAEVGLREVWFRSGVPVEGFVSGFARGIYGRIMGASLIAFCGFLLVKSVFSGGLTMLEIPKMALVVGLAGLMTNIVQSYDDNPEGMRRVKLATSVFGFILLVVMTGLLAALNDLGAVLIVGFVVLLVCYSVVFTEAVWKFGLMLYGGAFLLKQVAPDWFVNAKERLADWVLSDYFVTSGIRDAYVPGTASSTDFAKALWGIGAGGWTGRWTGLFALDGKDETYTASLAFAYNDRVGSVLIEQFGWLGLILVMVAFVVFICSALYLYRIPQQRFLPSYGLALGVASLFFGQVVVHFGGNFGFIPFTGIVLPFISHSGMAYFFNLLLITVLVAMYLPTEVEHDDAPVVSLNSLIGMFKLVYCTTAIVVVYAGYQTIIKGSNHSTRIRYDIQADKSIKRVINPRLFLLTDRMTVSGQIVDNTYDYEQPETMEKALIKNEIGEYLYDGFDERDYFLHKFEDQHSFKLKGLTQEPYKNKVYHKKICVLKDGDYTQFAGVFLSDAQKKTERFMETVGQTDLHQEENPFMCSVQKVQTGTLWNMKKVGVPVESKDPSKGCSIDGEVYRPFIEDGGVQIKNPNHNVWYFNFKGKSNDYIKRRLNPFLKHKGEYKIPVYPKKYEEVEDEGSNVCVVATWNLKEEKREGVKTGDNSCSVTSAEGKLVEYGINSIDGNPLGLGSARRISILDGGIDEAAQVPQSTDGEIDTGVDGQPLENERVGISNQCTVVIERVGCTVDDVLEIDQNDPDTASAIAHTKIYFGSNKSLGFTDVVCKVSTESMGHLKELKFSDDEPLLKAAKYYFETPIQEVVSNYEDDVVSLHKFAKSSVEKQLRYKEQFEEVVPQTILQIGLHGELQSKVRQILQTHRKKKRAPSVQALVFDVKTGHILAQAQDTQPRESHLKYLEKGDYKNLFTDQGQYGYGRNNLSSAMVPASTFKVYHGLAAIAVGHENFTHTCQSKGYLPADAKDWKKSIEDHGPHNHKTLSKAITDSCNQYFSALAYEHTYPEGMQKICLENNVKFGRYGDCNLVEDKGSYGASLNGFGQGIEMDLYQIAGVIQAASTNLEPFIEPWDGYIYPENREYINPIDREALFDGAGRQAIETHVLVGMENQKQAKAWSGAINKKLPKGVNIRIYGKTGTGDQKITKRTYETEKVGPYITERKRRNGSVVWIEDLEKPYGVKAKSNVTLFVALVEYQNVDLTSKVHTNRIGIVVRMPRSEARRDGSGASHASPIAAEIVEALLELDLIPKTTSPSE